LQGRREFGGQDPIDRCQFPGEHRDSEVDGYLASMEIVEPAVVRRHDPCAFPDDGLEGGFERFEETPPVLDALGQGQ